MLQQTRSRRCCRTTRASSTRFPDVASLAAAPIERVLELWSGLGYYRRAHHLHEAARAVRRADHGGVFPSRFRDARDVARHRSLHGGGDRRVRVRRARRDPRRQRQARARTPRRHRRLSRRAARAGAAVARGRAALPARRHRALHAGHDGSRRHGVRAPAALPRVPGRRRLRRARDGPASTSCRRRGRSATLPQRELSACWWSSAATRSCSSAGRRRASGAGC